MILGDPSVVGDVSIQTAFIIHRLTFTVFLCHITRDLPLSDSPHRFTMVILNDRSVHHLTCTTGCAWSSVFL